MPDGSSGGDVADVDVLVVGAGPTGLALAAVLAEHGVRFRVVDRLPDRVRESRALAVQPRTLEVLASLGLGDRLVALGNPAVRLQVHTPAGVTDLPLFDVGLEDTAYPFLLFVSQATTEAVLTERLAAGGTTPERGVELLRLVPDASGVACHLREDDGTEGVVRARYVVGGDGAHSTVRREAGIRFTGAAYPQRFVLADLEADGLPGGAAHAYLTGRGPLLFFPLGEPATWRMIAMRPRRVHPGTDGVTLDDLQRLADDVTGGSVRLHDPVWATEFRLHNRGAERYRSGRVFLAGDAAHIHSPAGAQGMNTGIQDAVNLGWKLGLVLRGAGSPALLDTYDPERAPVGRAVLRLTDRVFTVVTSEHPVVALARTRLAPRLLRAVGRAPRARRPAFRTVAQLRVGYRRSRLSVGGGLSGALGRGPRPGDRLPDAPVVLDGRDTRLHRALPGSRFQLLVWDPGGDWRPATGASLATRYPEVLTVHRLAHQAAPGVLHDPSGVLPRRLGLAPDRPEHLLVRPDGHVALRGGADLGGLRAYLERWLVARV